jgi:hypothetical protein
MADKILGYDWETIQAVQQKRGTLHSPVVPKPRPEATNEDHEMLNTLGKQGLRDKQFFGVLDRLGLL